MFRVNKSFFCDFLNFTNTLGGQDSDNQFRKAILTYIEKDECIDFEDPPKFNFDCQRYNKARN